MAGFASFGMPMGNDNSAAAKKARKEGLAKLALAKKSGYKGSGFIGGKSGPILESTSIGDFVNRLARNYTVDVGDATSRTIQDTFLGGKGKSNVLDYSLVKPDTGFGILDAAIKYNPTNLLAGNLLNNADFSQMLAPGDVVPVQKVASLGIKGVKASPNILKGIKMAAGRTSPDVLSAASGGLLRGSPVRAARSAPEPDEFDKIINAAKAEDPTLGDIAPEGTAPAPFRSELDWDPEMSVNYEKARQRIIDDLKPTFQKLMDDGEDPAIIDPLVDDSIAALHSEIGNLSTGRYNHNDLEDFLGRVAAPDDYIVADTWLAKRADNFVHDLGVEYEAWGKDPDKWLQEAGYGVDPEAFRGLLDDIGMDAANSADRAVDAVAPMRSALPLPQRFLRDADKAPDLSNKNDNEKIKILKEFLGPDTKRINVNTGEVGNVVGQADLERKYSDLVLRGRLSKRSRDYGKPYDFNAKSRANTIIVNREKEIGKQLSVENKARIKQEEINRNTTEHKKLIEDAAVNFKDEYDEAYNLGGMPEVLYRFEVAHIGTLTSGSRVEWSNVRLVPKEIHKLQGKKPWSMMFSLLVKEAEGELKRPLTATEKAAIKKKITLIR